MACSAALRYSRVQLVHQFRAGLPDADRPAARRNSPAGREVVDRAAQGEPVAPTRPCGRAGRPASSAEGMPQAPGRDRPGGTRGAASGPAPSGRASPSGSSRRATARPSRPGRPGSRSASPSPWRPGVRPPAWPVSPPSEPAAPRRRLLRPGPASPRWRGSGAARSPGGGGPAPTRGRGPPAAARAIPARSRRAARRAGGARAIGRQSRRGRGAVTSKASIPMGALRSNRRTDAARQEDQAAVAHQAGRLVIQQRGDQLGVDGHEQVRGQLAESGGARHRLRRRPFELEQESAGDVVDPARRVEPEPRADGQQARPASRPGTNRADAGATVADRPATELEWHPDGHRPPPSPRSAARSAAAIRSAAPGEGCAADQPARSQARPIGHPGRELPPAT